VIEGSIDEPSALRRALQERHGFAPDRFQEEAFDVIDAGQSVLVAAPTSAGKTLVAEYAIARALNGRGTVAYTTPIKALSNQKLADLGDWLGKDSVGLLTGDNVIRGDAPVVVMTTEVLRNMIYSGSERINDLVVVVLDEVHYLQDPYRGPVWEETIIQLPSHIQLVCLSATVSNAAEVAAWIAEVRGSCEAVVEMERPVALHDHFLLAERGSRRMREFRAVRDGRPNEEVLHYLERAGGSAGGRNDKRRGGLRPARPRRSEIVTHLDERNRLPAIFFVFSRQGCDDAVRECVESGMGFLDGREQKQVEAIAAQHVGELSEEDLALLGYRDWLRSLQSGIGSHHAGLVPPFKETVEDCFAAGLLKVVFATETLALGVNLPARSVVIESLTRFRGEGHVMLTPGEYTQLTGRAGRRGIDANGHAYTLWNPYLPFTEMAELVASRKFELESAFRPTYNMAANLVATRTRDDAVDLLHQSFAQYRSNRRIVTWSERLKEAESQYKTLRSEFSSKFGKTQSPQRPKSVDPAVALRALRKLAPGDVVAQPRQHGSSHLLVIGTTSRRGGDSRIRAVTSRGKTMMLTSTQFEVAPVRIGGVDLPKPYAPNRRDFQRAAARELRTFLDDAGLETAPSRTHDGSHRSDRARFEAQRVLQRSQDKVDGLQARVRNAEQDLGRTLDAIVDLLNELNCAQGWSLTPTGTKLSRVFHERDLVIAISVDRGLFNGLTVPEFVALASVLTYEHRGRDEPPQAWFPTEDLQGRATQVERITADLARRETRLGLRVTRPGDASFAAIAHGWASGVDLRTVLDGQDLGAGDFVRNIRQLVDVLRQLSDVMTEPEAVAVARAAISSVDRGVVLAATRITDDPDEDSLGDDLTFVEPEPPGIGS